MVEYHSMQNRCQFCDSDFEDTLDLIAHVKIHTLLEIRPYSCEICGSRFAKKETWKNHKCQGKGSAVLVCRDCKIYFQCAKNMDLHLIAYHAQSNSCPICNGFSSHTVPELLDHIKEHFNETSKLLVVCSKCMMSFGTDSDFYNHCCGVGFRGFTKEEVDFSSDAEVIVACSICGIEFATEGELEQHLQETVSAAVEIAKEKLCKCCNVKFATRSSFETHVIGKHLSSLQCCFCLKYFASRRAMEQHLLHHSNIHRHPQFCSTCSKIYFSQGLWENHSCESSNEDEEVQRKDIPKVDQSPAKV